MRNRVARRRAPRGALRLYADAPQKDAKPGHQALPHIGHLVPRGHDQRCLALLVHAAEPACVKKTLMPLPVTDAVGFAYLHRHAAARARVAVAGNYNWLSSFHVPLIFDATPQFG